MTFKEFMREVAYLPATVFSGVVNALLGSSKVIKDTKGNEHSIESRGLLGVALDSVKFVSRSVANFIANHKQAIATAFWASLALAGAAALTVFLWPAALTAVTTFSIYGLSIAGVVGANTLLQIGAVAALTFAATSVATYLTAAVVNTISALVDCCKPPKGPKGPETTEGNLNLDEDHDSDCDSDNDEDLEPNSPKVMAAALMKDEFSEGKKEEAYESKTPFPTKSVFVPVAPVDQPVVETTATEEDLTLTPVL